MAEYIDIDGRVVVTDTRGRERETTVKNILEMNKGVYTAADVRPVVKAYWIGEGDGYADGEMVYDVWHCSNCDYTVDEGDNEPPQYNFCPNCGAMMEES